MSSKITVDIKLFAYARELVGEKHISIDVEEGITIEGLMDRIIDEHPSLESIKENLIIAVNKTTVRPDKVLKDGDEIALLPPVAGG